MSTFVVSEELRDRMVAHCLDEYPLEGCGLLVGVPHSNEATVCFPIENAAKSARVYTLDSKGYLLAEREADRQDLEVLAVYHSHTHTEAYPSPTDVAQAPSPEWHYVLVSLAEPKAIVRSFRIVDGEVEEEGLVVRP